jgi:hypothetical protein
LISVVDADDVLTRDMAGQAVDIVEIRKCPVAA